MEASVHAQCDCEHVLVHLRRHLVPQLEDGPPRELELECFCPEEVSLIVCPHVPDRSLPVSAASPASQVLLQQKTQVYE